MGSEMCIRDRLWNASRLILLNAKLPEKVAVRKGRTADEILFGDWSRASASGRPAPPEVSQIENRWILSRLERVIASITGKLGCFDFAHAAAEAYDFLWSELCDWYLEIAKPRLYEGDSETSVTLLWTLERTLALLHPLMPFVTEEIWSYHPSRQGHLAVHPFPEADDSLLDPEAEAEVRAGIELTRRLRAWRDLVEAPAATVLPARAEGVEPREFVGRLARFEFCRDGGDPVAAVGPVKILASAEIDAEAVVARLESRREELRAEVARAEGKLGNEKFVARAPAEVVEEERQKLERYRAELEELSE